MDDNAKNISVENDAIEMPFTEDTGDVFEDAKMSETLAQESLQLSMWLNLQGPTIESEELDE